MRLILPQLVAQDLSKAALLFQAVVIRDLGYPLWPTESNTTKSLIITVAISGDLRTLPLKSTVSGEVTAHSWVRAPNGAGWSARFYIRIRHQ